MEQRHGPALRACVTGEKNQAYHSQGPHQVFLGTDCNPRFLFIVQGGVYHSSPVPGFQGTPVVLEPLAEDFSSIGAKRAEGKPVTIPGRLAGTGRYPPSRNVFGTCPCPQTLHRDQYYVTV